LYRLAGARRKVHLSARQYVEELQIAESAKHRRAVTLPTRKRMRAVGVTDCGKAQSWNEIG
jgi:hypothetical protein